MSKKTPLLLLILISLTNACGTAKPSIDIGEEFNSQPTVEVKWNDTEVGTLPAGFCSAALCMDYGIPDTSNIVFTTYSNGTPIHIELKNGKTITTASFSIKNTDLKTIHNKLAFTQENTLYTITSNIKDHGDFLLSMKWNFEEGGYYSALVPMHIE